MKLLEYQGKELFEKYGIPVPTRVLVDNPAQELDLKFPVVLKSQVPSGERRKKGGIVIVEEKNDSIKEWYLSLSYDTDCRAPVVAVSPVGGTGIDSARVFELYWKGDHWELPQLQGSPRLLKVAQALLDLFLQENALLAEINPLFELQDGSFIAGDAKVILDDNVVNPSDRPYLDLQGDIANLASGGGASLLNLDILMHHGGNPANYVEYSGNPPASV